MYFSPARSRRILRPGRIEHMSTQRRAGCTDREGLVAPVMREATRQSRAVVSAIRTPMRVATSLQQDPRFVPLVSHKSPFWILFHLNEAGSRAHRYSLPPISILTGSAKSHPTLPHAPAADCRWAERHDGKRNLHFKHAA